MKTNKLIFKFGPYLSKRPKIEQNKYISKRPKIEYIKKIEIIYYKYNYMYIN